METLYCSKEILNYFRVIKIYMQLIIKIGQDKRINFIIKVIFNRNKKAKNL